MANRNTLDESLPANGLSIVVGQPSYKRFVLKSLLPSLLLQESQWMDAEVLTLTLRKGWETWWADVSGNYFSSLSLTI